jgi:hypothetical protein
VGNTETSGETLKIRSPECRNIAHGAIADVGNAPRRPGDLAVDLPKERSNTRSVIDICKNYDLRFRNSGDVFPPFHVLVVAEIRDRRRSGSDPSCHRITRNRRQFGKQAGGRTLNVTFMRILTLKASIAFEKVQVSVWRRRSRISADTWMMFSISLLFPAYAPSRKGLFRV